MAVGSTQSLTKTSTRNISWRGGGKGGRCVGLTNLQHSCADCLEIWELQPPGTLKSLFSPVQGLLYLLIYVNETGCKVVSWIKVTYDRMQYQVPVNNAKSFEVSSNAGNLLKATTRFRRTPVNWLPI